VAAHRVVVIGDTRHDIEAAQAVGVRPRQSLDER
jgi:phosphoglycolate phosphatase-like HAD superfamily hydrolase